jgi:predicted O-methyltransferase YrrM
MNQTFNFENPLKWADIKDNPLDALINRTLKGTEDSDRHVMSLYGIALGSRGKVFIELGVRGGTTTMPLLLAAKANGGILYSVDINPVDFEVPNDLKPHWQFIQKDAVEFLKDFPESIQIDLVYVDDWHSYEHVKNELEVLDTKVSPSSVILLHDLMYGGTTPFYHSDITVKDGQWGNGGPYRAVAELNPQFWEFSTLPWNNGLTLLRKKYSNKYKQR